MEGNSVLAQVVKWGQNGNILQAFSTVCHLILTRKTHNLLDVEVRLLVWDVRRASSQDWFMQTPDMFMQTSLQSFPDLS